jgi:hypothetical protein
VPTERDERTRDLLACAGVLLFALAAFARTLGYGLYLDDNHHARPWTLAEVLSTFAGPFDPLGIEPPYYRPLVVVTFAVDWAIWGWNSWGYHLTNVLLHGLASAGVYVLCRALGLRLLPALAGGLYFAIIPANAATAVYVSERSDAMVVIFALASLQSLRWYRQTGRARHLLGVNAMLLLGVGSKEIAITIAPLLTLYWLYGGWTAPARVEASRESRTSLAALQDLVGFVREDAPFSAAALRKALMPCAIPFVLVALFLAYRAAVLPSAVGVRYSQVGPLHALASAIVWTFKAVPWEVEPYGLPFLLLTWLIALMFAKPLVSQLRIVVFGALWVVVTCVPLAYLGQVEPRLLYLPEVGHAVIAAALAAMILDALTRVPTAGIALRAGLVVPAALLLAAHGYTLIKSQDEFLPFGPKILHGYQLVLEGPKSHLYPQYHRDRIAKILAEHPPPE